MRSRLRQWVMLGLGVIVLGLIVRNLSHSPEWRLFDWSRFLHMLAGARIRELLLAVVCVYATYLIRAYRWRCFLDPIKRASMWILFVGQVLGFSSIFLIGRPGEFIRPAYIAKKENLPMSSMLAVWLLERIFDWFFLVALFAAAIYFEPLDPDTARGLSVLATMHRGGHIMFALMAIVVVLLVGLRLRTGALASGVVRVFRFLPARWLRELEHFVRSFGDGLEVIRNWRDFLASAGWTVLLWGVNTSIFWLVFRSLGGELKDLSWLAAGLTLFCAALGLIIQFPGIGGGYQVGAILALTAIFDVSVEAATSAGVLLWIIISVPCLILALGLLVHEGLTIKKLAAMVEEERAAVGRE